VANAQGVVFPSEFQIQPVQADEPISEALKEILRQVGVFARDISNEERLESQVGRSFYDDMPYKLNPEVNENEMVSNRLAYWPVLPVVEGYKSMFLKAVVDENGAPVLDEKGKPKFAAQDSTIRNTLGQAWMLYVKDRKEAATPEGFRAFLESGAGSEPKLAAALEYLDKLRDLTLQIKALGLTEIEYEGSKKVLLARVRPQTVKADAFFAAVMGPSTKTPPKTTASR
jgi:hypothetical protein